MYTDIIFYFINFLSGNIDFAGALSDPDAVFIAQAYSGLALFLCLAFSCIHFSRNTRKILRLKGFENKKSTAKLLMLGILLFTTVFPHVVLVIWLTYKGIELISGAVEEWGDKETEREALAKRYTKEKNSYNSIAERHAYTIRQLIRDKENAKGLKDDDTVNRMDSTSPEHNRKRSGGMLI